MCEYTPHSPSLAPREVLTISGIQGGAHRVGLAISSEWLPEVQASVVCSHLESAYQIRGCTQGWETTANGFISPLHPSKEKLSTPHFPSLKAHSLRATAGRQCWPSSPILFKVTQSRLFAQGLLRPTALSALGAFLPPPPLCLSNC